MVELSLGLNFEGLLQLEGRCMISVPFFPILQMRKLRPGSQVVAGDGSQIPGLQVCALQTPAAAGPSVQPALLPALLQQLVQIMSPNPTLSQEFSDTDLIST